MEDALAAEPFGIFLSLGHLIAVRQEDVSETSKFLKPSNQMRQVLW
jgi:hypothetical protein